MAKVTIAHNIVNSEIGYILEALPDAIVIVKQAGQVANVNGQELVR